MKLSDFPLLADENIDPDVIANLQRHGFDVRDVMQEQQQGGSDVDVLRHATSHERVIITHDADFGTLAIRQHEPLVGVIYLRPGHIDPAFTIATIDVILRTDPDVQPPFILVARRVGHRVTMRVRHLTPDPDADGPSQ